MSKLEVREIGPISGETEVRLADGATAVGFGSVGQVIQEMFDTPVTTSSQAFVDTGYSLAITPSSADSRIFVITSMPFSNSVKSTANTGGNTQVQLRRDGTAIYETGGHYIRGVSTTSWRNFASTLSINLIDSPNTLSEVSYSFYFLDASGYSSTLDASEANPIKVILMEIL